MFVQMMVGILLVELVAPHFVRTHEDEKLVQSFAVSGAIGCSTYLLSTLAAHLSDRYELPASIAAVSGFMNLWVIATLTAVYCVVQSRLDSDQRLLALAVAVGVCSFGVAMHF